jgi:hypothetical protein
MSEIPVSLATEDELSEAVLRQLIQHIGAGYCVGGTYRRGGNGYLRKTIQGWNRAARSMPIVILTDLDLEPCPMALLNSWLPEPKHPNLVFRVAVREVEAWLLADSQALAAYLKVPEQLLPSEPERSLDPKGALVTAARRSRSREIRDCIVPRNDSTAKQGREYNSCLCRFVTKIWDIDAASTRSESLRRAVARLSSFAPVWASDVNRRKTC